jgi:hypothetical protein
MGDEKIGILLIHHVLQQFPIGRRVIVATLYGTVHQHEEHTVDEGHEMVAWRDKYMVIYGLRTLHIGLSRVAQ